MNGNRLGPVAQALMPESNRLVQAIEHMDRASLDHLSELDERQRRRLRALCQHWADLAYHLQSLELNEHYDHRQMAGGRNT